MDSRRNTIVLLLISLLLLVIGGMLFWQGYQAVGKNLAQLPTTPIKSGSLPEATISGVAGSASQLALVLRVVDGDTIEVQIGEGVSKVRYIGVDTPETVDPRRGVGCFGKEASTENKSLVEGKQVILVKDISETDKFDRLLRYVYLGIDQGATLFVNDYLIRSGFGRASTYPPDVKFSNQFLGAEQEARENKRGLWAKC